MTHGAVFRSRVRTIIPRNPESNDDALRSFDHAGSSVEFKPVQKRSSRLKKYARPRDQHETWMT